MAPLGTILVIEDDGANRELLLDILSDEGYIVRGVRDAANGSIALMDYFPDLILCDLHLYNSDGPDFARRLQSAGVDIPVVLMTADNQPPDHRDTLNIASCLLKPFDLNELPACLARHINAVRVTL